MKWFYENNIDTIILFSCCNKNILLKDKQKEEVWQGSKSKKRAGILSTEHSIEKGKLSVYIPLKS